jgi:hypothetical protein
MAEEPFDWSELKAIAYAPEVTLDMYKAFPEDASKMIEVVDGYMVKAESARPSHQGIADEPKLHLRRPDVVVYQCITADRGKWGRKPFASDCLPR